jgi:hypothetical protein
VETEIHKLNTEIMALTETIKLKFPEVYRNLNEMPVTSPNTTVPEVKVKQLQDYAESLKILISTHTDKLTENYKT